MNSASPIWLRSIPSPLEWEISYSLPITACCSCSAQTWACWIGLTPTLTILKCPGVMTKTRSPKRSQLAWSNALSRPRTALRGSGPRITPPKLSACFGIRFNASCWSDSIQARSITSSCPPRLNSKSWRRALKSKCTTREWWECSANRNKFIPFPRILTTRC